MSIRAAFSIVLEHPAHLVIRDDDAGGRSVTNDAEAVVSFLLKEGLIEPGRRLFYIDSEGQLDEMLFDKRGFVGFAPGPEGGIV